MEPKRKRISANGEVWYDYGEIDTEVFAWLDEDMDQAVLECKPMLGPGWYYVNMKTDEVQGPFTTAEVAMDTHK